MAATYGALTWKPSQGTNLYCLVNRGTLVWTTCPRSLPDNAAAGNQTHDLPIASPAPYHYITEPHRSYTGVTNPRGVTNTQTWVKCVRCIYIHLVHLVQSAWWVGGIIDPIWPWTSNCWSLQHSLTVTAVLYLLIPYPTWWLESPSMLHCDVVM